MRRLRDRTGSFRRFPRYRTIAERPALIDLDRERIHALANLAAWSTLASQDRIERALADVDLPSGRFGADDPDADFDDGCCAALMRHRGTCAR